MEIKKAVTTHAESIIDFQLKMANETENMKLDIEMLTKGVESVFNDETKGIYYVTEENNKVIASLLTTFEWSDWRNGCVLWIQSVYVLPEFRGKGVFKKMYSQIKSIVQNSHEYLGIRLYVDHTNLSAQKVYDTVGMDGEHYKMYEWFK